MQPHYKKALIYLDGTSSEIQFQPLVEKHIAEALQALGIPYEFRLPHNKGFIGLRDELNQDDIIYILNDSLQFHLCEKPHVLISRSIPWVGSDPKPTTIGRLTQEMIGFSASELISIIARNTPMRQNANRLAASTYLLFNEYVPSTSGAFGRNGFAAFTWDLAVKKDSHIKFLPYESDGLAKVNEMLAEGMAHLSHPDDILIVLNRDICLTPEATGIIRAFMDSRNIPHCFCQRVDIDTERPKSFHDICDIMPYIGIDLFAFRKESPILDILLNTPLYIGRELWDVFWAYHIQQRLPFNICYHLPHDSDWQTSERAMEGNTFNREQVAKYNPRIALGALENFVWATGYKTKSPRQ
jgi:hypothetical protein